MANDQFVVAEPVAEGCPFSQKFARRYHQTFLIFTLVGLVGLLFLQVAPGGFIRVPLLHTTAHGLCGWKYLFGFDCPLCGMSRCFVSMAHGNVVAAWRYNPAGVTLFLLFASQVPYRIVQLRRIRRGKPELRHPVFMGALYFVTAMIALQWMVKVVDWCGS